MKDTNEVKIPKKTSKKHTVLDEIEEISNQWMNFSKKETWYDNPPACAEFAKRKSCGDVDILIKDIYDKISNYWLNRGNYRPKGHLSNWQLRKILSFTEGNPSSEKQLEKFVATYLGDNWFNQIPTASGLTSPRALSHANIDLVNQLRPDCYELIELKCESNNPLSAAIEILRCGLFYIHARTHQNEMNLSSKAKHLMEANDVRLQVLAPRPYYCKCDLGWFEIKLSEGIKRFVGSSFTIDFKFTAFPTIFQWNGWDGISDNEKASVEAALAGRVSAYT